MVRVPQCCGHKGDSMKKIAAVIGVALTLAASFAFAHGGGLDKNGCHHDRKNGGYHCH